MSRRQPTSLRSEVDESRIAGVQESRTSTPLSQFSNPGQTDADQTRVIADWGIWNQSSETPLPSESPEALRLLAVTADRVANYDTLSSSTALDLSILDPRDDSPIQGPVTDGYPLPTGVPYNSTSNPAYQFRYNHESFYRNARENLQQNIRRLQDTMSNSEIMRLSTQAPQTTSSQPREGEHLDTYLSRRRRETSLRPLENQEDIQDRAMVQEARDSLISDSITQMSNASLASVNIGIPPSNASADAANSIGQSTSARRDLERALRDYRIARRALRAQSNNEQDLPLDRTYSPYQDLIGDISAPNTGRGAQYMRARRPARNNALHRSDHLVERIAASAGVSNNTWRSDDDNDTVVGPNRRTTTRQFPRIGTEVEDAIPNASSHLIRWANGNTNISDFIGYGRPGAMGNFYQSVESRERERERERARASRNDYQPTNLVGNGQESVSDRRNRATESNFDRSTSTINQLPDRAGKPLHNTSKVRAKNVMKYLSELKKLDNNGEKSLLFAKHLGIDSLEDSLIMSTEVDLPMRIDEMPEPQYSSWLEPGMSWTGVQKGGFGRPDRESSSHTRDRVASGPLFEAGSSFEDALLHMRAYRHRERVRAERRTHEEEQLGGQSTLAQIRDETRGLLSNHRADTLADVEQHLSDLLQEEERRLRHGNNVQRPREDGPAETATPSPSTVKDQCGDQWPVQVTIHEVDWKTMTLTGTMNASQIPFSQPHVGMETFFDGEIIDFRTHELETMSSKPGYKVGGLVTDLKYWSRIGPFKEEVKKKVQQARSKKSLGVNESLDMRGLFDGPRADHRSTFRDDNLLSEDMDRDEIAAVVYSAMADCLSSCKWMEKTMGEGGWIFMRWKERCFINLPPASANNNATGQTHNHSYIYRPEVYTTDYTDDRHPERATNGGLTIRGFYYVAMHRTSGKIEALYYDSGSSPFQELVVMPKSVGKFSDMDSQFEQKVEMGNVRPKMDMGVFELR